MSNTPKYQKYNDSNETRMALLEQSIGHIDQTLMRMDARLDKMDTRLDKMDTKIDNLESKLNLRMDKLDNRLWQIIFLISSSIIAIVLGKIFHWL